MRKGGERTNDGGLPGAWDRNEVDVGNDKADIVHKLHGTQAPHKSASKEPCPGIAAACHKLTESLALGGLNSRYWQEGICAVANPNDELGIRQHGMRVSSGRPASTRSASFHCEEQDSRAISQEKLTITA